MGKPFKACFIQIDIKDIVDLLAVDDQGKTYYALYSKNGSNLSGTELGPVILDQNILDSTKNLVSDEVWKETCDQFENNRRGSVTFSSEGFNGTMCFVPIQEAGWEFAVLIHESVILDQIRGITEKNIEMNRNQIIFTLVAALILAVVLLLELKALSKNKLAEETKNRKAFQNMATRDSLTGARNTHAYAEYERDLNQKIQDGEIRDLAVVVCDINGLKHTNDTLGHAAGDQLIKDACALICEYFVHGTVFRIGGDEFAILLLNKGYDTVKETMRSINRKIEENITENGVVVSIGYSVLEKEDQQVRDVFERADKMMYDRKKALKAMGAKTRES